MIITPEQSAEYRQDFLEAETWLLGDTTFAGGQTANNKLDAERLNRHPEKRDKLLRVAAKLILAHDPDAIFGPPNGAQQFAELLEPMVQAPVIYLEKDEVSPPGEKSFHYATANDRELAQNSKRIVAFEDVTTKFTSLIGCLALPELRANTLAIVSFWRRGGAGIERRMPRQIPVEWLVQQTLPDHISENHPFYRANKHLAKGKLTTSSAQP